MKKFLITAIFAFIGLLAFAKENIAVFPIEDMDNVFIGNETTMFYTQFTGVLRNKISDKKYNIVLREDYERLHHFEYKFQMSKFAEQEKTAAFNEMLNGTQILSIKIAKVGAKIQINISLYQYPNLKVERGFTSLRVANTTDLFDKIPELVQKMLAEIPGEKPFDPRLGIALVNIFFGLGSYIDGDWVGGLTITGGYIAAGSLILVEIFGLKYEDPLSGVIGPIGIGIGGLSLIYGIARPYIRSKNPRIAYLADNFNIAVVSTKENIEAVQFSYKIHF